jgi:hypothetical protein
MSKRKHSSSTGGLVLLIGMLLFVVHSMVIAGDVQAVVEDPNIENKPGEILKLAFDLSRYAGK